MYSVVVPVLNEKENLEVLLPRLINPDCEVIVADNGSTDGSLEVAKDLGAKISKGSGSVSDAIVRGIGLVSYGKIIVMDGDLQHPPEVVPEMVKALDENDMVIASRCCEGGTRKDSFTKRVISEVGNLMAFGLAPTVKDRMSGFWGIRKEATGIGIRNTYKPMLEYLVRLNPRTVAEIPYEFGDRPSGISKLGRGISVPKTVSDLGVLYLQKFNRFVKYCTVGGIGTLICLAVTYFFTEVTGFWYMFSILIGAFAAAVWNFTGHKFVTYAKERAYLEPDYEWNAWYRGNPLQKYWKRKIGCVTKKFLGNPGILLDVGCGSSPVINLFHCVKVGLDKDQGKLDFIGKYSDAMLIQCDLNGTGMPTFTERFDAVVCNNILEHLEDPERVVEDISRRLKVGGEVVITVPNFSNPLTRLVEWLYGRVMSGGYAKEHCHAFSPEALDTLCSKYGLSLVGRKSVFTDMVCCYAKDY